MRCVAFKPDNPNILVSCSFDKTIKMWDITSGSCLWTLKVNGEVSSLDFSPCGTKIAAASNDWRNLKYQIKIFSLNPLSGDWEIGSEPPLSYGSRVLTLALKDNMIVAGCDDGTIRIFKLNQSQDLAEIQSEPPLTCDR